MEDLYFFMIVLKAERYTHGVRLFGYSRETYYRIEGFLKKLELREPKKLPHGRMTMELKKKYYGVFEDLSEIYIHVNSFVPLLDYLETKGIPRNNVQIKEIPVPTPLPAEFEVFEKYVLRDYQELIHEDITEKPHHSARVDLFTGYGKATSNETPVRIPSGWKPMGEIVVGDTVIGRHSQPTTVTGVYPQGEVALYRVTFEDGRSSEVCGEHLWQVHIGGENHVIDTNAISKVLESETVGIPLCVNTDPNKVQELMTLTKGHYFIGAIPLKGYTQGRIINTLDLFHSMGYIASVKNDVLSYDGLQDYLDIVSIKPIPTAQATCITVDAPDNLFLIGDYVVTHNTLISLYSAKTLGHRVMVMLPPKYFGLWEEALDNTYKDIQMRYVRVSGSPDLKVLIDKVQAGELTDVDVFLVSNITYRNYIEAFENNNGVIEQLGYNVTPFRFHELLGIGLQINDEIQEDPGLLFRIDMYTNVAKQIYLSATPFTGNDYVTKMIDVMLPESTKVRLPKYESYIDCVGVLYNDIGIRPKDYLTPFKNTYNHARYETVMRDRPKRLKQYFEMIDRLVEGLYSKDRLPGQKLLILCSTVAFIELMVEHLTKRFPDLGVYGYTSGSSYEKLLASDITVSTIKSAGTGVDIPNLREVLLCQATDSKKDSIQILGRLRPLRDFKDVTPRLTYLCCENIPHHCRYARNKEKHLEGRTKSMVMRRIRM